MTPDLDALLDQMTIEEQVSLLSGASFWRTASVPRLGIPSIKVTDGPNGARGENFSGGITSAAFPVAIALAASWDVELVRQVGVALAQETKSKGAQVLLAPTVNMHRNTLNGRNFECFSEDPHLASEMAVAYIQGVQSEGVAATVKHFIGNETEVERRTISAEIDERTLREIYLPPFEAAVKRAGVWCVMTAYNYLNGTHTSQHPWLLETVLRQEWGFDGVVMSDWTATHSTTQALLAGLDLEMPGPGVHRGAKLVDAVASGEIDAATVRSAARRMLTLAMRTGSFEHPDPVAERADDRPEHRALIRRAGAQGAVLLKNDSLLPVATSKLKRVAVIGPNAMRPALFGGGSAQINAHYRISPIDGLKDALGPDVIVDYALGCPGDRYTPLIRQPISIDFFNTSNSDTAPVLSKAGESSEFRWFGPVEDGIDQLSFSAKLRTTFLAEESGIHVFGLMSAGTSRLHLNGVLLLDAWSNWTRGESYFGHGCDELLAEICLEAGQQYDIDIDYACGDGLTTTLKAVRFGIQPPSAAGSFEEALALAAAVDVVVLMVGLNDDWETEAEDRRSIDLPGKQNNLVDAVLAANPDTVVVLQSGSPLAMPWLDEAKAVLQLWYPGQECGNALADVLTGAADPGGRLPMTFPKSLKGLEEMTKRHAKHAKVAYGEGVDMGYRHFEKDSDNILFPFGHGLSYGSFHYRDLQIGDWSQDEGLAIEFTIENRSHRLGQEIAQIYLKSRGNEGQSLVCFLKQDIGAGSSKKLEATIPSSAFERWDNEKTKFNRKADTFQLMVGRSATDIRLLDDVNLQ
ncbi:beta-glucosidase [Neorhizobium galegae]|uniref:beta-glucosidase n=1 Tax=Neorhizobium galegae TaxID=399 RepID=UPI0021081292|nr:glycoside hydrolase family 3 protein [Neorhizobium galegae]MCQ1839012.1 glycoside hydrolase family 3 C-terminal domain-containing protein [Neorhizobium galegae]